MRYKIIGNNLQVAALEISGNEVVYGEAGAMVYMTGNINMTTRARGGFMKGLKRKMMGESFFLTEFTTAGGNGVVAFGGNCPGTIRPLVITPEKSYNVIRDGFLCAENTVEFDMATQRKLGTGIFGGEGFILQKMTGNGTVFIHAPGDFIEKKLAPGQSLKVSTGHAVAWEDTVSFDIQRSGNVKSAMFSGEGIFVTTLTGPGTVILQSMTLGQLARSLTPYLPRSQQSSGSSGVNIKLGR